MFVILILDVSYRIQSDFDMQQIRDMVDDDCSLTLKELQVLIEDMFGVQISKSTIANYIVGWRYSLKRITVRCEASFTPELELARREEELLEAIQSFVLTPLQAQNYIGHAHKNAINCLAGLAMDN